MDKKELLKKLFSMVGEDGFTEGELEEIEGLEVEELMELIDSLEELTEEGGCNACGKCHHEGKSKDDIDIIVGELGIKEEITRQENLYDKKFDASEETKATDLYKEMVAMAESVVAGVRVMIDGGIDYNNALQLCSNLIQNKQNLEVAKLTQIQVQNNQI